MGKKILKLAGIGEIIMAVFFLGVAIISKDDGGALFLPDVFIESVSMLVYIVAGMRLLFGLFGMLGKGRPMLIFFSFLLILFSIPSPKAGDMMLIVYVIALVISLLYLLGALLLKKPKDAVEAGAAATATATGAAANATATIDAATAAAPAEAQAESNPAADAATVYPAAGQAEPVETTQTEDNSAN